MHKPALVYLRAESNRYLKFRKLPFYPLNYRGFLVQQNYLFFLHCPNEWKYD